MRGGTLPCVAYFVYLVECTDTTLYCGYTVDVEKRLKAHNAGKGSKYTRSRLPVKLVYVEKISTKSAALKREYAIKKMSRAQKKELFILRRVL